jgi:NAD(P)-dependent dehydrogenase (short-subunit alcohol dehydrogenase family)
MRLDGASRHVTPPLPPPAAGQRPLDGSVALVVGAGRGLGRAAARALAEHGCDLVIVSRSDDELQDAADEIRGLGKDVHTVVCDATDSDAVAQRIGPLDTVDILVNSAGTNVPMPFVDVTDEIYERIMNTNVRATVMVTQHVVRAMLRDGRKGSIVNVSSQMGHVGAERRVMYCTSKHAIEGFTKALAVELGPAGIRVNSVAPTFVETEMTAPFLADPTFRQAILDKIPLGRLGTATEVADAITFLASPHASLITGTSLLVDGGWTAH